MKWLSILILAIGCNNEPIPREDALPYRYFLVASASGDLRPGFGVAQIQTHDGMIRTSSGRVMPAEALEEAHPVHALGIDHLGVGWVVERQAGVWARPDDSERPLYQRALFDRVAIEASVDNRSAPPGWRATHEGFMRGSELRVPSVATRPVEAAPGERWIDVDTESETLSVYDGDQLRFVTLVSTGQGRPGSHLSTPRGVFRINYKAPAATMDNLDEGPGQPAYSFEEVPWVQYFHKDVALHGAYWHSRFGHAVSHGCVNLTPADAQRVYALTRASTPAYAGTIVRVR